MALKPVVKKIDDVDESLREHYEERDGQFVLALTDTLPGFVPKAQLEEVNTKLGEFRENNNTLKQDVEARLREINKLKESGGKPVFDEEEHNRRVADMQKKHQDDLKARDTQVAEKEKELDRLVIHNGIQAAAIGAGARDTAVVDIVNRLAHKFTRKDGDAVMVDGSGNIIYGPDGKPSGVKRAIEELKITDGKHLFKGSSGDGAGNEGDGAAGGYTITREEARDPRKYRAAKEKAQKAGKELQVAD